MPLVALVLFSLGGFFVPGAVAATPSVSKSIPLVNACAWHLQENFEVIDAVAMLTDWEESLDALVRIPHRRVMPPASYVDWPLAFVRQSDCPALYAREVMALNRYARKLHRAVWRANPEAFPSVFGPQLLAKETLSELFLGTAEGHFWDNLSRSISREERRSRDHSIKVFAAGFVALAGGFGGILCREDHEWAMVAGATVAFAGVVSGLRSLWCASNSDKKVEEMRQLRGRHSGDSILRLDRSGGPFPKPDQARRFRDFARAAVAEWNDLSAESEPRWFFFTSQQAEKTVDVLIRTVPGSADDLEMLAIVR